MGRRSKKGSRAQPFFFLVGIEFCEQFNHCVLRGILSLYMVEMLMYSECVTKIIYHTFAATLYILPLFGGIIADNWLGRYKTLLYLSLVCAVGNVVLAVSAIKAVQWQSALGMVALTLIVIGTAGVKPCLVAFGRDQFELPKHQKTMDAYFYFFYFVMNVGSFLSLIIAPLLRKRISCLGQDSCYPLAFFVPAVLMALAIALFRAGRPLYTIVPPEGSMLVRLVACIRTAARNKLKMKEVKKDHWLDYALEEHGEEMVQDTKALMAILRVFLPVPIFWTLFEQQATSWTFQARHLDGHIGKYFTILPDQMQIINPTLVLMFIPIFEYVIYPGFRYMKVLRKPLQRMAVGGMLAAIAFALTAAVQYRIEEPGVSMRPNRTLVTVFNFFCCDVMTTNAYYNPKETFKLGALMEVTQDVKNFGRQFIKVTGCNTVGETPTTGVVPKFGVHRQILCWSIVQNAAYNCSYLDETPMTTGKSRVRLILNLLSHDPVAVSFYDSSGNLYLQELTFGDKTVYDIEPGGYGVEFGCSLRYSVTFAMGAVYILAVCMERQDKYLVNEIEMFPPNSMSMAALLPQWIVITLAEVMFVISGLEFAYQEAPDEMIPVMQFVWLLSIGAGQLLVVVIETINFFIQYPLTYTYLLYTGLTVVNFAFFIWLTYRYKYTYPGYGG